SLRIHLVAKRGKVTCSARHSLGTLLGDWSYIIESFGGSALSSLDKQLLHTLRSHSGGMSTGSLSKLLQSHLSRLEVEQALHRLHLAGHVRQDFNGRWSCQGQQR